MWARSFRCHQRRAVAESLEGQGLSLPRALKSPGRSWAWPGWCSPASPRRQLRGTLRGRSGAAVRRLCRGAGGLGGAGRDRSVLGVMRRPGNGDMEDSQVVDPLCCGCFSITKGRDAWHLEAGKWQCGELERGWGWDSGRARWSGRSSHVWVAGLNRSGHVVKRSPCIAQFCSPTPTRGGPWHPLTSPALPASPGPS